MDFQPILADVSNAASQDATSARVLKLFVQLEVESSASQTSNFWPDPTAGSYHKDLEVG